MKTVYIVGGVVALVVVLYFVTKKEPTTLKMNEDIIGRNRGINMRDRTNQMRPPSGLSIPQRDIRL